MLNLLPVVADLSYNHFELPGHSGQERDLQPTCYTRLNE
jgi:hypothetical protein